MTSRFEASKQPVYLLPSSFNILGPSPMPIESKPDWLSTFSMDRRSGA